jgi:hypothetical protein
MATKTYLVTSLGVSVLIVGCGGDDARKNLPFGETAIVVVLNPEPNDANTATPPATISNIFGGVDVDAVPGGDDVSDSTGLAVVLDVEAGDVDLVFDGGPLLPFAIERDGDVYDLAVALQWS